MTGDDRLGLPHIPDRQLYKAVKFVQCLIEDDKGIGMAIRISSKYYGVSTADISKYVRIMAAREKRLINRWRSDEYKE